MVIQQKRPQVFRALYTTRTFNRTRTRNSILRCHTAVHGPLVSIGSSSTSPFVVRLTDTTYLVRHCSVFTLGERILPLSYVCGLLEQYIPRSCFSQAVFCCDCFFNKYNTTTVSHTRSTEQERTTCTHQLSELFFRYRATSIAVDKVKYCQTRHAPGGRAWEYWVFVDLLV